jgi:hypothetical protein
LELRKKIEGAICNLEDFTLLFLFPQREKEKEVGTHSAAQRAGFVYTKR